MQENKKKNWLEEHKEEIIGVAMGSAILGIASSMCVITSKVCDVAIYKLLGTKLD